MFYIGRDDSWYSRDIPIEEYLVNNYEIWPSQVVFSINMKLIHFVLFRTKFTRELKFLKLKTNVRITKITEKQGSVFH